MAETRTSSLLADVEGNAQPNNLSRQLTSFIGRESEVAEARRLLATTRLLTLTGSGGVGKTRLSQQVAAWAAEQGLTPGQHRMTP